MWWDIPVTVGTNLKATLVNTSGQLGLQLPDIPTNVSSDISTRVVPDSSTTCSSDGIGHVGSDSSDHYGCHISTGVITDNLAINAANAFAVVAANAMTDVAPRRRYRSATHQ